MWGDAAIMSPTAKGGADTFVLLPRSADDLIFDFRHIDSDKIDVSAYGFTSINDLTIASDGNNTVIRFDSTDSVTLVGVTDPLTSDDFVFQT
jgi:hypothetical protein